MATIDATCPYCTFLRRDGSLFPVSFVSVPPEMPDGRGAVVAFNDIEDRLRAEEVLRQHDEILATQQASLRRIATLVAGGGRSAEVFAAIAREVAGVLGVSLVAVWRYESDGTGTVVGAWSEPPDLLEVGSRWRLDDTVIISRVRETGRPARSDDLVDFHGTVADIVREAEIRSAAGAPIVVDGDVWGVMAAGGIGGARLPDRIEDRLAGFTELVATAISNT
jgi:GAF domain-containing protein